jgi:extracellular solute-binding protein
LTHSRRGFAALGFLLIAQVPAARAQEPLRVRVGAEAAPCLAAASQGWSGGRGVAVETAGLRDPGAPDVLVGAVVEMTRALEGGQAVVNSDVDIAEIPWVLVVAAGNPLRIKSLDDAKQKGVEVVVFAAPAAYDARRVLAGGGNGRVRESSDRAALRAAAVALVPLSLAGPGERIAVSEVPPMRTVAAVGIHAAQPERAGEFVRYLGSEAGQRAFAGCGGASR